MISYSGCHRKKFSLFDMHRQPTTMLTFRLDLYRVYTNTTTNERTISNIFHSKHRCLPHQIYAYLLAFKVWGILICFIALRVSTSSLF